MPDQRPGPVPTAGGVARPEQFPAAVIDELAAIADSYLARGGQPGLVYGIVAGGSLVHTRGIGERWLGGPAPDAGTVFRIASMTKSFTAAAVLALRDDGALALDDLAEEYVPELRSLRPATADSPRISVRNLLTMTAGLPTDDPWGDREQGTPDGEFAEFLAGGISFAWATGTRFEYANLGYAILGRVITAASGTGYADFVRNRLLEPLGMTSTGFEAAEFAGDRLARGYRRGADGWEELVPDGYGAFAPMGGVFSTVSDLTRWVSGFAAAFPPGRRRCRRAASGAARFPARDAAAAGGPSAAAVLGSRQALAPAATVSGCSSKTTRRTAGSSSTAAATPASAVTCAGTWTSGIGVIVLANSTYAPRTRSVRRCSKRCCGPGTAGRRGPADASTARCPAPGGPWPETLTAQRAVSELLRILG